MDVFLRKRRAFAFVCCCMVTVATVPMAQDVLPPEPVEQPQGIGQRTWRVVLVAAGAALVCLAGVWAWRFSRRRATRCAGAASEPPVAEEDGLTPQINQLCADEVNAREGVIFEQECFWGHCDPDGSHASGIVGLEYHERRGAGLRERLRVLRAERER